MYGPKKANTAYLGIIVATLILNVETINVIYNDRY